MFRLYFKTFTGAPRNRERFSHAHESPWVMTVPLIILAFFSIVAGYGGWFERFNPKPELATYTTVSQETSNRYEISIDANQHSPGGAVSDEHVENIAHEASAHESEHSDVAHKAHYLAMVSSLTLAAFGILFAYLMFYKRVLRSEWLISSFRPVYTLLWNKYFIDELYHEAIIKPLHALVRFLGAFDLYVIDGLVNFSAFATRVWAFFTGGFDNRVIDGAVNGTAEATGFMGNTLSFIQTGKVRNYLLFLCLGAVILVSVFVFIR
jgi:NADH-quinone oxidoreductase subunit L